MSLRAALTVPETARDDFRSFLFTGEFTMRGFAALVLSAFLVTPAAPSSAIEIALKSPVCGAVPGAGLVLDVDPEPSVNGFDVTATATLCRATAVLTSIELQFADAGAQASPPGGGPMAGAPFAVSYSNSASVSGSAVAPSGLGQVVVVNVSAQSVTVGAQYAMNCQAFVQLVAGTPVVLKGC